MHTGRNSKVSFHLFAGNLHLSKVPTGQFYSLEMQVADHGINPGPKSTNVRLVLYNERSSSGTGAGSVYVGSSRASVPVSVISGATTKVPVYANVAFQDLEGIDVTVRYPICFLMFKDVVDGILGIGTHLLF